MYSLTKQCCGCKLQPKEHLYYELGALKKKIVFECPICGHVYYHSPQ